MATPALGLGLACGELNAFSLYVWITDNEPRARQPERVRSRAGPSWREFLRLQAASRLACDFFTVETISPIKYVPSPFGVSLIEPAN